MLHIPPKIDWKGSAVTGHPAKSSRFERDKFTGYLFAPFVDALTDDRRHIEMRGCRYTAPPLTSTGSVVYRALRGYCSKFYKCTKGRRFHNHVGAFRRKADYKNEKKVSCRVDGSQWCADCLNAATGDKAYSGRGNACNIFKKFFKDAGNRNGLHGRRTERAVRL